MQGNSLRIIALAAFVWTLLAFGPAFAAPNEGPIEADPIGFWLVGEHGPPVSDGLAAIPILGRAVRGQISNPRAVLEIRREGDGYAIDIPSRELTFKSVARDGNRFRAEAIDPETHGDRVSIDITVADGKLTGRLAYTKYAFDLDGHLPESVDAMRREIVDLRARLTEAVDPYSIPENEKLRQENIVLIERIRRVEDELQRRGAARPRQDGSSPPHVSTKGLVAEGVTAGPVVLRSAPSLSAEGRQQIGGGQPLFRIADAATNGWILVADRSGNLGFVRTAEIVRASAPSQNPTKSAREIVVSFPSWDAGRIGKRMTVVDPGFVSIVGRVRSEIALKQIRISDSQTVFNSDGSFTSVMQVPPQGRRVRIEASFADGQVTILDFEIAVGK